LFDRPKPTVGCSASGIIIIIIIIIRRRRRRRRRRLARPQNCPFQSSFTQRAAQFTQGIPQFPQFTCRHHKGIILFQVIHSADEHRMIYSFSNISSYSTFNVFFSSFSDNIMADVASKQQTTALFFHHSHKHKNTHKTKKKLTNLMGNLCCAREHSVQFFVQFFTQLNCTF
jgi:hypothetical protein